MLNIIIILRICLFQYKNQSLFIPFYKQIQILHSSYYPIQKHFIIITNLVQPKAMPQPTQQIKTRIKQHGKLYLITELCLDQISIQCFTPQINTEIQKCTNLTHLSLTSCSIKSLKKFPQLKKLKYLDVQNNKLEQSGIQQIIQHFQSLDGLNISNNSVKEIQTLINLANSLLLKELNIFDTAILKKDPQVVEKLFQNCKTLQCINWEDRKGKQVKQQGQESDEESLSQENDNNLKSYSEEDEEDIQNSVSMHSSKKVKVE